LKTGGFPGVFTWHTNFEVRFASLPQLSVLALDWVARGSAAPYAGVGPEAELHAYDCGTTGWLGERIAASPASDRFFLVQHHPFHNRLAPPFHKVKNFTFDAAQDAAVQEILSAGGSRGPSDYLGVVAGHMHRWKNNVSAFTPFTAVDDDAAATAAATADESTGAAVAAAVTADGGADSPWLALREYETSAAKGWWADEAYTSAITLFAFGEAEGGAAALLGAEGKWLAPGADGAAAWGAPPAYGGPVLPSGLPVIKEGRYS
jgi:hypothetical protein